MELSFEKLSFFGLLFELEKDPDSRELKECIQKRLDVGENGEFNMTDIEKFM